MKRLVLAFLIIFFMIPIPFPSQVGVYNTITGWIWCNGDSCYHEIGHKLDQRFNWISHTEEFNFALQTYLFSELRKEIPERLSIDIIQRCFMQSRFPRYQDVNAEAYAIIFEQSKGRRENMPELFRDFYDWELAEKLIARHIGD